jgi:ferredoxin
MAKVLLRNDGVLLDMPDGARLLDYAKTLPLGCLRGECGQCLCSVSRGNENVERKTQMEEATLIRIGAYPSQRLACQIIVRKGEIEIEY